MSIDPSGGHPAMDYPEHERTYSRFLRLTQVSTILIVIALALMAFFLT